MNATLHNDELVTCNDSDAIFRVRGVRRGDVLITSLDGTVTRITHPNRLTPVVAVPV